MVLIYSTGTSKLYIPMYQLLFKGEPLEVSEEIAEKLTKGYRHIKYFKGEYTKPKQVKKKEIEPKTKGGSFKKY